MVASSYVLLNLSTDASLLQAVSAIEGFHYTLLTSIFRIGRGKTNPPNFENQNFKFPREPNLPNLISSLPPPSIHAAEEKRPSGLILRRGHYWQRDLFRERAQRVISVSHAPVRLLFQGKLTLDQQACQGNNSLGTMGIGVSKPLVLRLPMCH